MNNLVVFPDATALAIAYLGPILEEHEWSVPVVSKVPNPRPTRFVRVRRVGGGNPTIVSDAATLAIECWADESEDAHDLAQLAWAVVRAMRNSHIDGHTVYMVQTFAGPTDLPDPTSGQPRYTFTVSLHTRGEPVAP